MAGRPANFTGAVGSYRIEMRGTAAVVQAEDPLVLTVRITGQGPLQGVVRPELRRLPRFTQRFHIEDAGERDLPGENAREYDYRLRPRSPDVKEVPSLAFSYFKPGLRPPERGYQTTSAKAIPIVVKPRERVVLSPNRLEPETEAPPEAAFRLTVGDTVLRREAPFELPGLPTLLIVAVVLPGVCWLTWAVRASYRPDVKRRSGRRSRAGKDALHALRHARGAADEQLSVQLAQIVTTYLRYRLPSLPEAPTTAELLQRMRESGCPAVLVRKVGELLQAADAACFSPGGACGTRSSVSGAVELIVALEDEPWPHSPS